jgi:hypothetical protein
MLPFILSALSFLPLSLKANVEHAPRNFKVSEGKAIFVDFLDAAYNLTYDSSTKSVTAISTIHFEVKEEGLPLFDLVANPTQIILDGESVQNKLVSTPDSDTKIRLILKNVKPGMHTCVITSPIESGINFLTGGVSSAFWYSDLDDRSYLEAYLPTNYEYDQYRMTYNIDFKNLTQQKIYTNGLLSKIDDTHFKIEFPKTYTSSSSYFHTAPIGRYTEKEFVFSSIDGRNIPVIVYTIQKNANLETAKNKIIESLSGLESQFGPFLHQTVTVFLSGSGGMEYCGATMTELWALNHELTHSYFARGGFMPANGNSGWIDEAITTWSDEGSLSKSDLGNMTSNMAGHSEYRRYTDDAAYTKGRNFIGHLHYKFESNGGIFSFLTHMIQSESFKPMTTEEFTKKVSAFYSEDLTPLFKKYVYDTDDIRLKPHSQSTIKKSRQVHMKMSIQEMEKLL